MFCHRKFIGNIPTKILLYNKNIRNKMHLTESQFVLSTLQPHSDCIIGWHRIELQMVCFVCIWLSICSLNIITTISVKFAKTWCFPIIFIPVSPRYEILGNILIEPYMRKWIKLLHNLLYIDVRSWIKAGKQVFFSLLGDIFFCLECTLLNIESNSLLAKLIFLICQI